VLLRTSNYVFDKDIILYYLNEYKKCPITGLTSDSIDIVELKNTNFFKPRFSENIDINSLLTEIKHQWDLYILEYYQLKNNLLLTRQELVFAYYQNDAAYRALIQSIKEKNKLKKIVKTLKKLIETIKSS